MEQVQPDLDALVSSLASLLASPNSFSVFEDFWRSHGKSIRSDVISIGPKSAALCLNLLEQTLNHGPTAGVYGVKIAHADYLQLRKLDCAYDIWDLLVQCGRRPYIREKLGTDWDTHERHITESYLWEVKARLTQDTEQRISLFRKASNAAQKGVTKHCISRANSLEAHAIRLEAEMFVRKREFRQAAKLLDRASALVRGKDHEWLKVTPGVRKRL